MPIALLAVTLAAAAERPFYPYSDEQLFERGQMAEYAGEHLEAVSFPVGGVGSGAIHIDGRGVRHGWMIFSPYWLRSNPADKESPVMTYRVSANQREPLDKPTAMAWYMSYVPDSYFAVRVAQSGGEPTVRVLQTLGEGPFEPVDSLTLRAAYPLAWYDYHDDDLPVKVSMRTWNPLIPNALKDSSMPCAIYDITVENPTDQPLEVSLLATQQNAVGLTGHERAINGVLSGGPSGQINRIEQRDGVTMLRMTTALESSQDGCGDMALATNASNATTTAEWYDPRKLYADFAADGALTGPSKAGPTSKGTVNGALAQKTTLQPGEKHTITFVLGWYFPNASHGGGKLAGDVWKGRGNYYTNWWPNAAAVAGDVIHRYDQLESRTLAYQQGLYESNLPYWFLQRISSQVTPIRTRTVWWDKSGYFGAWEGMSAGTGSCGGNCLHVWHYAQAYARLFPELGRIMRRQDYAYPRPDGGLPYRQPSEPCQTEQLHEPATDGQLGVILATYREYLTSTDDAWLRRIWPSTRSAMQFVIDTWDADHDGELYGIQHTTLDCKVGGSTSWLGSMYLAALRACENMARIVGDDSRAEVYRKLHVSGSKIQSQTLFNGEYFIQTMKGQPDDQVDYYTENDMRRQNRMHPAFIGGQNYFNGCEIDQLLGQWWANQLDLGYVYPKDDVRTALRSLFKYNYYPTFKDYTPGRVPWVDPDDGGMVVLTMPHGADERLKGKKLLGYNTCTLTGFEYAAAAAMIREGLLREGMTVVKTISDRYDGRMRVGLHKTAWGYSGNPFGDDESGKWYARAQSSWSLLLAAQGFMHDGPRGVIGFDPVWKPDDHRSFFTSAAGFGVFSQKRAGNTQTCALDLRDGHLNLRRIVLHLPDGTNLSRASVKVAGRPVAVDAADNGRRVELSLNEPIVVAKHQQVEIQLKW